MPLYDFKCYSCDPDKTIERLVRHSQEVIICECGRQMTRQPPSPFFKIEGFNFKNGYFLKELK